MEKTLCKFKHNLCTFNLLNLQDSLIDVIHVGLVIKYLDINTRMYLQLIYQGRNNNSSKKAQAYTYLKKTNLLASFAFVQAHLLPKVLYCQCRLVACSE